MVTKTETRHTNNKHRISKKVTLGQSLRNKRKYTRK